MNELNHKDKQKHQPILPQQTGLTVFVGVVLLIISIGWVSIHAVFR